MKKSIATFIAAALMLLVASCGGFDRGGAIDDLVEAGFPEAQAACVVDGIVDELGEDRVTNDDDPTPEETEIIEEITLGCLSE